MGLRQIVNRPAGRLTLVWGGYFGLIRSRRPSRSTNWTAIKQSATVVMVKKEARTSFLVFFITQMYKSMPTFVRVY